MTAAIHVWRDEACAAERDAEEYYSVSEVADDGEEIRCIGGSRYLGRAWEIGLDRAHDLGVPCVEYAGPASCQGQITDRWDPPGAVGAED